MKQTLITRLILGAFAGLAAVGAYAGQIQSSSTSIAREVIQNNGQQIASPSIAYRFAGDVDARANDQTFQVQFTLNPASSGHTPTWGSSLVGGGANSTLAEAITITDGVTSTLLSQSSTMTATDGDYTVIASGVSPDNKTVWATIRVWKTPGATAVLGTVPGTTASLIKQPLVTLNATSNNIASVTTNTSTLRNTVTNLFDVVGDIVAQYNTSVPPSGTHTCNATVTDGISFKHYTAVTDPMQMVSATNTGNEDESQRSGSTNLQNGWLVFPTNIGFTGNAAGTASTPPATQNAGLATGGNLQFADITGAGAGAGNAYQSATLATLGYFNIDQTGAGLDSDLSTLYDVTLGTGSSPTTLNNGTPEIGSIRARVYASSGFASGSTIFLDTSSTCATAGGVGGVSWSPASSAVASTGSSSYLDVSVPTASVAAALGGTNPSSNIYVCYAVPGTTYIPSSQFTAEVRLIKGTPADPYSEQDDICNGPLTALGGSIKIDVRNYLSSADAHNGWTSTIRLINTSETKTADIQVQLINQDGTYGNWTNLSDMPPLSVRNYSAAELDAALAAGTATAVSGSTSATPTAAASSNHNSSPRLRFTSQHGDTLRIQNYVQGPLGMVFEASGSEGVDFTANVTRTPIDGAGGDLGQSVTQDAQKGIDGK